MKEIKAQYQEFLDKIVQEYKGRTFCYNPPVSSEDADLTLVGRNGLRLEFRDAGGSFDYLSIDDFLQLAQTPTKCTEPRLEIGKGLSADRLAQVIKEDTSFNG